MKLIILAAGDSFELDGFNKLTIKHPKFNMSIIEIYRKVFKVDKIQVIVGFRAMNIMNDFPEFEYILNDKWQTTGSAYSLSLALDEHPSIVISSDFIFNPYQSEKLDSKEDNVAFIKKSESKRLSSLKCEIDDKKIVNVYRGKSKEIHHNELIGMFKISDPQILNDWKLLSMNNPSKYAGETLPFDNYSINYKILHSDTLYEINTPSDYINLLKKYKYE